MSEVKRYIIGRNGLPEFDDSGEYVATSDYDALAAKLAMAEDATAKGDAARHQCGGMEMEIEELRAELAELRARVVVPDGYELVPVEPNDEMLSAGCVADNAMHSNLSNRDNKHRCYQSMLNAAPRLNGKTVSEGLLRRLTADPDYEEVFTLDRGEALTELLDLLNQDKENGNG
ncbi:hypothetical protein I5L34_02670 [Pseudomonas aeruginosa]|uniref:hypothetical protein n=1 Tax=Pseudomonas aeruginosa TaxID=287 RepID=UPI00071B8B33|nr:hypothetical protein [Pseudomonas aeruginosa]KSC12392.1 hypothetical protein AO886_26670 [Pseudomonas aeruginosa]MBH9455416.1 hypothetical protein [Pseudomonas aeruginosa]MBH9462187.1 hypothetical protein [Pseudomonas aeruginosa]QTB74438.1 hypothetical protein LYSZa5_29750 [Pseudomonas aeruginosa]QTB86578.1 hypothetical protein LYSZa2_29750 [Pseudomonas aeruginosa]